MKFLADLGTRLSPSYVRGRFFSVFYLHHLLENKGQDVLPMGSGEEAWRELSTWPFVFGGQEESEMAVCPGPATQDPAAAKGATKGFPA